MLEIVRIVFGSHLYGTNNENSDEDYKGIFLPSKEDLLLGKVPKSINLSTNKSSDKNDSNDVDVELYSLHYFIHLACEGETVALDMLHAPTDKLIFPVRPFYYEGKDLNFKYRNIWIDIVNNRNKFYTKNLKAFVGYARKQASKYGVKGSRLNDAERVLQCLDHYRTTINRLDFSVHTLGQIWDTLPTGEHIHKDETVDPMIYEVCGRKIQRSVKLQYAYDVVRNFVNNYGERARMAATNDGIDWKAVSHAIRAALQTKEILTKETITFPLKEANLLKDIKEGKLDYLTVVAPMLENLISEVEELSAISYLPEKVNRKYWDDFIIRTMEQCVLKPNSIGL